MKHGKGGGYANTEARGGHSPSHAAKHDSIITHLSDNDHLTKRGGGEPTHGSAANFKSPEPKEQSMDRANHPALRGVIHSGPRSTGGGEGKPKRGNAD